MVGITDIEWKKRRVLDLLEALVAGKREEVKSYLTEDGRIVFPGFRATGHAGADELFQLIDSAFDGCPTKTYDPFVSTQVLPRSGRLNLGRSFKDGNAGRCRSSRRVATIE